MGLPGSGKTTMAKELSLILNAVHFNADEIRKEINKDLKFTLEDRVEHADIIKKALKYSIEKGVLFPSKYVASVLDTFGMVE